MNRHIGMSVLRSSAGYSRSMVRLLCFVAAITAVTAHAIAAQETHAPLEIQKSDWNGYEKQSFVIAGHAAYVVVPHIAAPGKPWVWRTSFPDYQPVVDLELVRDGYHIGYIEVLDLLGSESALDLVDQFYAQVRAQWGLSAKMAVEPCSRGGLPAYRYAARHPERIACIYGDVPVLDFKSWPLQRPEKATEWPKILSAYGFKSDADALAYRGNPIDELAPIARAKIPIRHVICLNDRVVPPEQNTLEARRRLQKLGSDIDVVSVKESDDFEGHHFPYPEVDASVRFIMDHTDVLPLRHEYYKLRDGLTNCRAKFEKEKVGRVAFFGGSITFNPGWRDELMRYLQQRFPDTKFDFIAAGIPSLGSVANSFRLERDVLSQGPVDLLFVEAAVNDAGACAGHPEQMLRGMEGIVRHVRAVSPSTDIVQMHFVTPEFIADYNAAKVPLTIAEHEKVADAYGCTSLNLALEVADRIKAGEFAWADFANVHPSQYGQRVYTNSMMRMLDAAWRVPPAAAKPHPLPKPPVDRFSYYAGRFGKLESATLTKGFSLVADWTPTAPIETRPGYVHVPTLSATEPGSEFQFEFDGNAAGLMIGSGPDSGIIEVSVDGGATRKIDTLTQWSGGLYLPWAVILADGLRSGHHSVRVRLTAERHPGSAGTALYVFNLMEN